MSRKAQAFFPRMTFFAKIKTQFYVGFHTEYNYLTIRNYHLTTVRNLAKLL